MAAFSRKLLGHLIHLPNLFRSEVDQMNQLFDLFDKEIELRDIELDKLAARCQGMDLELHKLRNIIQADLSTKELKEKLNITQRKRRWWRIG